MAGGIQQEALFDADVLGRPLPVVGEQKDIRYFGTIARSVLNGPEIDGDGLLVDQSVRRLRVRLRVLLRALRAPLGARPPRDGESRARRPAVGARHAAALARVRAADLRQAERRRRPAKSLASRLGEASRAAHGRDDRHRHGDRSVSAGRAAISHHALGARGAGRASRAFDLHHHQESACHARHRSCCGASIASRRCRFICRSSRLDRELARRLEPRAPTPEARLRALARLRESRHRDGHQRDAGAAGDHRQPRRSSSGW